MDRTESGNSGKCTEVEMEIERENPLNKIKEQFKRVGKIKYALILAVIGVCILLLPVKRETVPASVSVETVVEEASREISLEDQISQILSHVEGAGKVQVMLTFRDDGEVEYQTDVQESRSGETISVQTQTVFGGGSSRESALVCKKTAPEVMGAVVIAQGADSVQVCYDLTKAVCSLTGLGSNKVTILKMKG